MKNKKSPQNWWISSVSKTTKQSISVYIYIAERWTLLKTKYKQFKNSTIFRENNFRQRNASPLVLTVFTQKVNTFNLYKIDENIYTRETKSVNFKKENKKTNVSIVDIETVYSISHLHEFEIPEKSDDNWKKSTHIFQAFYRMKKWVKVVETEGHTYTHGYS